MTLNEDTRDVNLTFTNVLPTNWVVRSSSRDIQVTVECLSNVTMDNWHSENVLSNNCLVPQRSGQEVEYRDFILTENEIFLSRDGSSSYNYSRSPEEREINYNDL